MHKRGVRKTATKKKRIRQLNKDKGVSPIFARKVIARGNRVVYRHGHGEGKSGRVRPQA